MNALDVDFKKYIPNIIDAFVQVYGEEYRAIITKRINSIQYVIYNNVNGISSYHSFLSTCKKQELSLKFLNQIGIDTSKYNVKSYAEHLNDDINTLLYAYIDGAHWGFHSEFKQEPEGIKSFSTMKKNTSQERILNGQINFLNFYRGKDKEQLTLETLEQFKETEEYSSISKKIDEYLRIYSLLFTEYEQYLETIKEYEDYYKSESQRRLDILEAKKSKLYNSINLFIPTSIKNMLDNNCTNDKDKAKVLFNDGIIWSKLYIEYFSQEDEDKINNPTLEESEKKWIYYYRISFFKSLGFDVDPWKEKDNYNEFIQRKDIKPLIPTAEFIKKLCDIIGVENYEALNDSINKVDFLLDKGLWKKIQENQNEDPLVIEYTSQLARVEQIYKNIDMQNFADTQVTHKR